MAAPHPLRIERVYSAEQPGEGYRVLVDRIWPRGISKARADLAEWDKDVAPTTELRTWFGHVPARFEEFARRYTAELDRSGAAAALLARVPDGPLTLVYSARDTEHNQAVVLRDYLLRLSEGRFTAA